MFNFFKRSKILTFKDLVFQEDGMSKSARKAISELTETNLPIGFLESMLNQKSARIEFGNGYFISVKLGDQFWSNGIDTYEAYSNLDREAHGHLTSEEVTEYMIRIQNE